MLGTRDNTAEALTARLHEDPRDRRAYVALRAHYRSNADHASLANLLGGWASFTEDVEERTLAHLELAELLERRLGQPEQAAAYYRAVLTDEPGQPVAKQRLKALQAPAQEPPQGAQVEPSGTPEALANDIIESQDAARRAELLATMVGLAEQDPALAEAVIEGLEAAQLAHPTDALVARELSAQLSLRFQRTGDDGDRKRAGQLLFRIALGLTGDERLAYLQATVAHDPSHEEALQGLEDGLRRTGRAAELPALWVAYLASGVTGAPSYRRRVALAKAYRAEGQLDDARFCLQPAADAQDPDAIALLSALTDPSGEPASTTGPAPSGRLNGMPATDAATAAGSEPVATQDPSAQDSYGGTERAEAAPGAEASKHEAEHKAEATSDLAPREQNASQPPASQPPASQPPASQQPTKPQDAEPRQEQKAQDSVAPAARLSTVPPRATSVPPLHLPSQAPVPSADPVGPPALASEPVAAPRPTPADGDGDSRAAAETSGKPVPSSPPAGGRADAATPASAATGEAAAERPAINTPAAPADPAAQIESLRRGMRERIASQQKAQAVPLAVQLLSLQPVDREAFNFLDGHYRRERLHAERCALLVQTGSDAALPTTARALRLREAATLLETRLKDMDGAIEVWSQVVVLDEGSDEARRNLKRLYERSQRWDDLAAALEAELTSASADNQRAQLLKRLITLHREQRADVGAAADTMARLYALQPRERGLLGQLVDAYLQLGRYEDAAPLLSQQVEDATSNSQRANLLRKLAQLQDEHLGEVDRAVETYGRIVDIVPTDAAALRRMEELDREAGNYDRLLATLERRCRFAADEDAAALLVQMSEVAEERLDDRERALAFVTRALSRTPGSERILDAFCGAHIRAGRFEVLVDQLREHAIQQRSRETRIALYRRIARTLDTHLDDRVGAAETWQGLLAWREDPEALRYLEAQARQDGDHEALVDCLARLAKLEDGDTAPARLLERAAIMLEQLGRPADAAAELAKLLDRYGYENEDAFRLLEQACETEGNHQPLARALEKQLARREGHAWIAGARALAALYADRIDDPTRALKVLDQWTSHAASDPEPHRLQRPLLEARHQHEALLETLDALQRLEPAAEARTEAAIAAANLSADRLADLDGAWARLTPLAEAGQETAIDALCDLAARHDQVDELSALLVGLGEHARLEAALQLAVDRARDDDDKVAWLRRLAHARQEHLEDLDGAERAHVALLEIRDDAESLQFRRKRATQRDEPELLADCLARLAALQETAAVKRDLLFELSQLQLHRLHAPADATTVLRRIVEDVDPAHEPALDALVEAAGAAADHPTLATALEKRLSRVEDSGARATIGARLADLYEGPLDDADNALTSLRRWREAAPQDPEALRRLRRRLEYGDPVATADELLDVLDCLAALETDRDREIEVLVSAAVLARDHKHDEEGAFQRLIDHVNAGDPEVDEVLRSLTADPRRFAELLRRLEQAQRHDVLVSRIEERVADMEAGPDHTELRRRAARVLAQALDQPDHAGLHYLAILDHEEDPEALRFMQTRAMAHQDAEQLADYLRRLAAVESDPAERRDLLFDHAHVLRAQLDRPEQAAKVLRGVVAEYPDFEAALDELAEACFAAADHLGYAQCLERMLEREQDPAARVEQAQRLVQLYETTLDDPTRAEAALRSWAAAAPQDAIPLRRLRTLLEGPDRVPGQELLAVLDGLAARERAPEAKREAAAAAGTLCATHLDDTDGAWQRLLPLAEAGHAAVEPTLHEIAQRAGKLEALCQLFEGQGRYDDLVRVLGERAEQATGEDAVELLRYRARTLRDRLDDDLGAVEAWRELLVLRDDPEALAALAEVARREDDPAALESLLERLSRQLDDPERKQATQFERARLLGDRLGREDEAITVLLEVLRATPVGLTEGSTAGSTGPSTEVVDTLIALCERRAHYPGLAEGLRTRLSLPTTVADRERLGRALADLYGGPLPDASAELEALALWRQSAPQDPEPRRRLRARLEAAGREGASGEPEAQSALLTILDELGRTESDPQAHSEATRAAATLCLSRADVEGALSRLAPLILRDDREAEAQAAAAATTSDLKQRLASLFVRRAQGRDPSARRPLAHDWHMAATLLEQAELPTEALEAGLRMFALNTEDDAALDHVDRLAAQAGAWDRLEQVYRRIARDAAGQQRAAALCLRISRHLDVGKGDPQRALEWALRACRAWPGNEQALGDAERLATAAGSHQDLLFLQEERARNTHDAASRIAYLTSAARTADLGMGDREQAIQCLTEALVMTVEAPEMAHVIETTAKAMDEARPDLGADHARRSLARAHVALSERIGLPDGPKLILRAARLLRDGVGDPAAAYDVLRQGTTKFTGDAPLLDELSRAAIALQRLDGLDAHLAKLVKNQADRAVQILLLRRRAALLSTELQRFETAARVYGELLSLAPQDAAAWQSQEWCLRKAGRFRELAKLYEQRTVAATTPAARAQLLRSQAKVWETDLRNRNVAQQLWEEAAAVEPDDEETVSALNRLRP